MYPHIKSNTVEYTDSELWLAFINGEKEAFSRLYHLYYTKMYSYGLSMGMTDEQVRDIIQELFVKIYNKPGLIKEVSTIKPFLFTSMRNAFINQEKYRKRFLYIDQMENFEFDYIVENIYMEDEEEEKRIKATVEQIINVLTPRQKEIIYLRFLHQMEYDEISKIMGLSEQAARNLTYRAMEKMRKQNPDAFLILFLLSFLIKT